MCRSILIFQNLGGPLPPKAKEWLPQSQRIALSVMHVLYNMSKIAHFTTLQVKTVNRSDWGIEANILTKLSWID